MIKLIFCTIKWIGLFKPHFTCTIFFWAFDSLQELNANDGGFNNNTTYLYYSIHQMVKKGKRVPNQISNNYINGGGVYDSQFNGRIDLVNTFRKHTQAYSARIQYKGSNKTLEALHKEFKINETIIRQLNARLTVYNEKQLAELVN